MQSIKSPFAKDVYERNAKIYRLLANPKRLEILNLLKLKECSVDELSNIMGIRKANTSQHLTILRLLKLVNVRKQGKHVYYTLSDPRLIETCKALKDLHDLKVF